jgi:hypothetical protein
MYVYDTVHGPDAATPMNVQILTRLRVELPAPEIIQGKMIFMVYEVEMEQGQRQLLQLFMMPIGSASQRECRS